jgi:hypothetical protein
MGPCEMLARRVATAEAVWKVGVRHDQALLFLAWALKDEHWGVSHKAAQALIGLGWVPLAAVEAGVTAFRSILSHKRAPRVSFVVR